MRKKNIKYAVVALLIALSAVSTAVPAWAGKQLTIVYSGMTFGSIFPKLSCCGEHGGLARRTDAVRAVREAEGDLLLVDVGGIFHSSPQESQRLVNAEVALQMMHRMGYDALNLGSTELAIGMDFLESKAGPGGVPLLSSNLADSGLPDGAHPFLKTAVTRMVGDARVAVVGVANHKPDAATGLRPIPAAEAVRQRLAELRPNADFIVVLAFLPQEPLDRLMETLPDDVDVVIASSYPTEAVQKEAETPFFWVKQGDAELGYVKLAKAKAGARTVVREMKIPLDQPESEQSAAMLDAMHVATAKAHHEAEQQRVARELGEVKSLSPREYLEQLQQSGAAGRPIRSW